MKIYLAPMLDNFYIFRVVNIEVEYEAYRVFASRCLTENLIKLIWYS